MSLKLIVFVFLLESIEETEENALFNCESNNIRFVAHISFVYVIAYVVDDGEGDGEGYGDLSEHGKTL